MIDQHAHTHPSVVGASRDHAAFHRQATDATAAAAIAVLRQAGERVTGSRRAVLEVLASRSEHLSADQVAAALESEQTPVHRATVYRTLERLAEIGVATSMQVTGGAAVYHLAAVGQTHEHLHARCRSCGEVFVLPPAVLSDAVARVAADRGFVLDPAQSTLVGLCAECSVAADR
ncbi:Fur family transcriptional regulator [Microbacterium lacus]|uniref:Fur family transcriptional regulator n=1 Tax=Microbacterium lacus TaxID=415217 RepID=UPI0012FDD95F|nr:Fur family transcriptional regulator [Microbacterium lacus]